MKEKKLKVELWLSVGLCIFGCGLLSAGFICAPIGIIDTSVLIAFGEVSTFAGALLGIDYHKNKVLHEVSKELTNK